MYGEMQFFQDEAASDVFGVTTLNQARCYRILLRRELDKRRVPGVPSCRFCKLRGQAS
jgi:hypothetical protein